MAGLSAPFDEAEEIVAGVSATSPVRLDTPAQLQYNAYPKLPLVLPAVFETKERSLRVIRPVDEDQLLFWTYDLDLTRLNRLHKHLWLAGLPQPPRPLHNHLQIGRAILITERLDMHMLWTGQTIYLKPLPTYLLCNKIWIRHLCADVKLHQAAIGFLRSYVYLIVTPSDFKIAIEQGLLDSKITWHAWTSFVRVLCSNRVMAWDVNPRFLFGELRLDRINWTHRFCMVARRDGHAMIRGYSYAYRDYETFLVDNLAWLLTASVYLALVLTAMQVGLATDRLKDNRSFQNASYGFTVFVIIAPLIIVAVIIFYVLILVLTNLVFTRSKKGQPGNNDPIWRNAAMHEYKH